jgi:hypothetical protein
MAIDIKSAARLTVEQIRLIGEVEKKIDDWLGRKYSGGRQANARFEFPSMARLASEKVMKALTERYKKAGWRKAEFSYEADEAGTLYLSVKLRE